MIQKSQASAGLAYFLKHSFNLVDCSFVFVGKVFKFVSAHYFLHFQVLSADHFLQLVYFCLLCSDTEIYWRPFAFKCQYLLSRYHSSFAFSQVHYSSISYVDFKDRVKLSCIEYLGPFLLIDGCFHF